LKNSLESIEGEIHSLKIFTVKYLFSGESFCPDFPKKGSFFPENKNPGPENQALQLKVFFLIKVEIKLNLNKISPIISHKID